MVCPNCGNEFMGRLIKCPLCGFVLESDAEREARLKREKVYRVVCGVFIGDVVVAMAVGAILLAMR